MERYTYFDGGKWRLRIGDTEYSGKAVDRLAAYEDTGLEPEEVEQIRRAADHMMFENVSHFVRYASSNFDELQKYKALGDYNRLRELAQSDREGKLPKYTIGDTVYDRFGMAWTVDSLEYVQCTYEKKWLYRCGHPGTNDYRGLYQDEVLTREEAEAALEGMKNG